jgi:hypothetical protein
MLGRVERRVGVRVHPVVGRAGNTIDHALNDRAVLLLPIAIVQSVARRQADREDEK